MEKSRKLQNFETEKNDAPSRNEEISKRSKLKSCSGSFQKPREIQQLEMEDIPSDLTQTCLGTLQVFLVPFIVFVVVVVQGKYITKLSLFPLFSQYLLS